MNAIFSFLKNLFSSSKPDYSKLHVVFFYRTAAARNNAAISRKNIIYPLGLGVSAQNVASLLEKNGIKSEVMPIWDGYDIDNLLKSMPTVTHAVLEAPFIGATDLDKVLLKNHPNVKFMVRCHSQIAFLQVEPGAIKLIKDYLILQNKTNNFDFSSNSDRLTNFLSKGYDSNCVFLPNLYDMNQTKPIAKQTNTDDTLKISSFGATRTLKNHTTSAAAAILLTKQLNKKLEFYVNVNREEHGQGVLQSLKNMFDGLENAKLVEVPWSNWEDFKTVVAQMDLCMQMSFSETFNLCSADSSALGIPSVVSEAISWLPNEWKANPDDPQNIVEIANKILNDRNASQKAMKALENHNKSGIKIWMNFFSKENKNN